MRWGKPATEPPRGWRGPVWAVTTPALQKGPSWAPQPACGRGRFLKKMLVFLRQILHGVLPDFDEKDQGTLLGGDNPRQWGPRWGGLSQSLQCCRYMPPLRHPVWDVLTMWHLFLRVQWVMAQRKSVPGAFSWQQFQESSLSRHFHLMVLKTTLS